jgi:methionyl-tRNA formyltransferase
MPIFFDRVIPELREEIVGIGVVSPIYKNSTWTKQAKRFVDAFGVREFTVEGTHYAGHKAAELVRRLVPVGRHRSVKGIARQHGLRLLTPEDVNAEDFLDDLRALEPDLVVSVSCPQIFKRELLELPRIACVNLHSALLPDYRGMLPTFWVLARGEEETGVTMHYMTPGIDGGGIVLQRKVSIEREETLHSLMRKCKASAAEVTLEAVKRFREGPVPGAPNPEDGGSYFSFPTRDDVREFKRLGRSLR